MKKIFILIILTLSVSCSNIKNRDSDIERKEYTFLKGMNLYQKGELREALKEYKKVYSVDSQNVVLIKEIAMIYYELGDRESSIDFLKRAKKLSPKDDNIKKNLAVVYYSIGNLDKAEEYINLIPKSSNDSDTMRIKGYIAFEKKDYEKAYINLKDAEPIFYEEKFYSALNKSMIELGKEIELYSFLNNSYKKHYNEKSFIILYCNSLSEIFNETDSAEKIMMRYISEYGGEDKLYLLLSNLYLKNGEIENAVNSFKLISKNYEYNKEYIELKNKIVDISRAE